MTCLLRSVSWQVWLAAKTFAPIKIVSVDTINRSGFILELHPTLATQQFLGSAKRGGNTLAKEIALRSGPIDVPISAFTWGGEDWIESRIRPRLSRCKRGQSRRNLLGSPPQ